MLRARMLDRHRDRIDSARSLLARRGSIAVFLGRSIAFFRAVMPALAGMALMPYRRFLVANAAGGIVWGVATVLLGFLAGNSYHRVEKAFGRGAAIAIAAVVLLAIGAWVLRRRRSERH
jgi:membrane-associated protein